MANFIITRDHLETMYLEGNHVFITSLVNKYKSQIIRANSKGMKTCSCYFGNEDMNIIEKVVNTLKETFVDTSFNIVRPYLDCGEIIIFWGKAEPQESTDSDEN
jgi:hypothetical protein